jgi:hypothetical protein
VPRADSNVHIIQLTTCIAPTGLSPPPGRAAADRRSPRLIEPNRGISGGPITGPRRCVAPQRPVGKAPHAFLSAGSAPAPRALDPVPLRGHPRRGANRVVAAVCAHSWSNAPRHDQPSPTLSAAGKMILLPASCSSEGSVLSKAITGVDRRHRLPPPALGAMPSRAWRAGACRVRPSALQEALSSGSVFFHPTRGPGQESRQKAVPAPIRLMSGSPRSPGWSNGFCLATINEPTGASIRMRRRCCELDSRRLKPKNRQNSLETSAA